MKKTNNFMNAFKPEKLSLNPIKRRQQKKRNAQKKAALQMMIGISAACTAVGTTGGLTGGYFIGKYRTARKFAEAYEGGVHESPDEEESEGNLDINGNPIQGTPPKQRDVDVRTILIREGTDPSCQVVRDGKTLPGFCLSGKEPEVAIYDLLDDNGIYEADIIQLMYDFDHSNRQIEIIKHAIMRYACDAEVNVTTVDTNAVDFGIRRDSTSKDSEQAPGDEGPAYDSEDDPYAGMNSLTDQEALQNVDFPSRPDKDDEPENEEEESSSESESGFSVSEDITDLDEFGETTVQEEFSERSQFNKRAISAQFRKIYRNVVPAVPRKDPELNSVPVMKAPENTEVEEVHQYFFEQAIKIYLLYCKNKGLEVNPEYDLDTIVKGDITVFDLAYSIQRTIIKATMDRYPNLTENQVYAEFIKQVTTNILNSIIRVRQRRRDNMEIGNQMRQESDGEMLVDEFHHDPTEEPQPEESVTDEN